MTSALSASGVQLALGGAGSAQLLLQLYGNILTSQPAVTLPLLPGYGTDQKLAAEAAQAVLTQGTLLLIDFSAQALGFANLFEAMADQLTSLAAVLDDATTPEAQWQEAAATFSQGLSVLMDSAVTAERQASDGQADFATITSGLQMASVSLQGDLEIAAALLTDIDDLRSQLVAIQDAMDADNATLARGATAGALSSVKIGLSVVVAYYKSPKDGVKMLVGGIKGVIASGQEQQQAADDLAAQMEAYQAALTELLVDTWSYVVIQNEASTMSLLVSHSQEAALSLQTARDAWAALVTKLGNLQDALAGSPDHTLGLSSAVSAARTGWAAVLETVQRVQANGAVPVESA